MSVPIIPINDADKKTIPENFVFGKNFANYMYTQKYNGEAWVESQIEPYGTIPMSPASAVFHYAQECFEGAKAYRRPDGNINLFRFDENCKRFNRSAKRLSMPQVDPQAHFDALVQLVELEQEWVPEAPSTLYIRPTLIASSAQLGLKASKEYLHFIIMSPVGSYFAGGFNTLPVYVSTEHVRSAPGGTGDVKAGGNYAASVFVSEDAKEKGYAQVLWLDAVERKYVEEVGAMNIMFVYNGKHIVTPELSGTILPGITRDSVLKLAPDLGYTAEEARLDINDIVRDIKSGEITEIFGTGTAAAIAPVGQLGYNGEDYIASNNEVGDVSKHILEQLQGIQFGRIEDPYGWTHMIETKK